MSSSKFCRNTKTNCCSHHNDKMFSWPLPCKCTCGETLCFKTKIYISSCPLRKSWTVIWRFATGLCPSISAVCGRFDLLYCMHSAELASQFLNMDTVILSVYEIKCISLLNVDDTIRSQGVLQGVQVHLHLYLKMSSQHMSNAVLTGQ